MTPALNQCSDDIHGCYATLIPYWTGAAPRMTLGYWTTVRVALDVRTWKKWVERPRWSRLRPNRSRVCRGGRAYAGSRTTLCPGLGRGPCTCPCS